MRKLLMTMAAVVVAVAMTAGAGLAQRGGGPAGDATPRAAGPRGRGGPDGRFGAGRGMFGSLNLTDEQRSQVRAIMVKSRDEAAPLVDRLQLARKDLRRAILADTRDSGTVKDLNATVQSLQKQVGEIRLTSRTAIADLLTLEQREQLRAMPRGSVGAGPRGRRPMPPPAA